MDVRAERRSVDRTSATSRGRTIPLTDPLAAWGRPATDTRVGRRRLRRVSLLQKNVLNRRTWATREQLRIAIVIWIERPYHRRRRQDSLGRLTPIEYESIMTTLAGQAA